jgi:AcrR family transcriptional regulator
MRSREAPQIRPTGVSSRENEAKPSDATRANIRRQQILEAAADLYAVRGFEATSMRDVAAAVGLMSGSLYYHFASKEDLYVAVEDASVLKVFSAVQAATAEVLDPWARFEAGAVAHCETLLDPSGLRVRLAPIFPPGLDRSVRDRLIGERDRFEQMIAAVIAALPLARDIDRHIFQKHYLSAMNSVGVWYSPDGRLTPAEIARQLVRVLKGS